MHVKIITPSQSVYEGEVGQAKFPGVSGGFEILKGHAPIISVLGKGQIFLGTMRDGDKKFKIDSGVVEVLDNNIVVLVETITE